MYFCCDDVLCYTSKVYGKLNQKCKLDVTYFTPMMIFQYEIQIDTQLNG